FICSPCHFGNRFPDEIRSVLGVCFNKFHFMRYARQHMESIHSGGITTCDVRVETITHHERALRTNQVGCLDEHSWLGLTRRNRFNTGGRLNSSYQRTVTDGQTTLRSEEHTSELQSRFDLVCRLLLEKKKNKIKTITAI